MARILLIGNNVGGFTPFGHLQFVLDPDGRFDSGDEVEIEVNGPLFSAGSWVVEPVKPMSIGASHAWREVVSDADGAEAVWQLLLRARDFFTTQFVEYETGLLGYEGQNSNTYIRTMAHIAGIDIAAAAAHISSQWYIADLPGYDRNVLFDRIDDDNTPVAPIALDLDGTSAGDVIQGGAGRDDVRGGGGGDRIVGYQGADTLSGEAGGDSLHGDDGEDDLYGGADADWLTGGAGDDSLWGGTGDDTLEGGAENDTLRGEDGQDDLYGDTGDDLLIGGAGHDHQRGGEGQDALVGEGGRDWLWGDDGDDTAEGGAARDRIWGGSGADDLYGDAGRDRLFGGAGRDLAYGGGGADLVAGGGGHDGLYGDAGADTLKGGQGADLLDGGSGADLLLGQGGFDDLIGGPGDDTLTGGGGRDVFIYAGLEDEGADLITDFVQGSDWIQIDGGDLTFADLDISGEVDALVVIDGRTRITLTCQPGNDLTPTDFDFAIV